MSDVSLYGDIKIDSSKALRDLEQLSKYFDNIYAKLNNLKGVLGNNSPLASSIKKVSEATVKANKTIEDGSIKVSKELKNQVSAQKQKLKVIDEESKIRIKLAGIQEKQNESQLRYEQRVRSGIEKWQKKQDVYYSKAIGASSNNRFRDRMKPLTDLTKTSDKSLNNLLGAFSNAVNPSGRISPSVSSGFSAWSKSAEERLAGIRLSDRNSELRAEKNMLSAYSPQSDMGRKQQKAFSLAQDYMAKQAKEELRANQQINRELEKKQNLLRRNSQQHGSILDKLFNIRNLVAAIAASELVQWINRLVDVSNKLVAVQVRFQALAKSSSDAAYQMQWIYKTAKDMRQPMLDASSGYSKFFASAVSTMPEEDIQHIYKSLLMTSTVMHIMPYQFNLVSLAIEQMSSKGVVSMEELRRQLGEHIPGAFGIAARSMGKTQEEFNKMVKNGEVMSKDFLPKFAKQLDKELGSGLAYALQSPQSKLIALQNSLTDLAKIFSEGGFGNAIGNFSDSLRKLFESDSFTKGVASLGFLADKLSQMMPALLSLANIVLMIGMLKLGGMAGNMLLPASGKGAGALSRLINIGQKRGVGSALGIVGNATGLLGKGFGTVGGISGVATLGGILSKGFAWLNIAMAFFPTIIGFFEHASTFLNMIQAGDWKGLWNQFWTEMWNVFNRLLFGLPQAIMDGIKGSKEAGKKVVSSVQFYEMFDKTPAGEAAAEKFIKSQFRMDSGQFNTWSSRGGLTQDALGKAISTMPIALRKQMFGTGQLGAVSKMATNYGSALTGVKIDNQHITINIGEQDKGIVDSLLDATKSIFDHSALYSPLTNGAFHSFSENQR